MKRLFLIGVVLVSACEKEPEITARPAAPDPSEFYTVEATNPTGSVGDPLTGGFKIKAAPGWKVNTDYPWKFEIAPLSTFKVNKNTVERGDVKLDGATAEVPVVVTPTTPGTHKVDVRGRLSICNPDACHNFQNQEFAFTVEAH